MKHRGSSPNRMDVLDRHNRQRDKRTNGRTDGDLTVGLINVECHALSLRMVKQTLMSKLLSSSTIGHRFFIVPYEVEHSNYQTFHFFISYKTDLSSCELRVAIGS